MKNAIIIDFPKPQQEVNINHAPEQAPIPVSGELCDAIAVLMQRLRETASK